MSEVLAYFELIRKRIIQIKTSSASSLFENSSLLGKDWFLGRRDDDKSISSHGQVSPYSLFKSFLHGHWAYMWFPTSPTVPFFVSFCPVGHTCLPTLTPCPQPAVLLITARTLSLSSPLHPESEVGWGEMGNQLPAPRPMKPWGEPLHCGTHTSPGISPVQGLSFLSCWQL